MREAKVTPARIDEKPVTTLIAVAVDDPQPGPLPPGASARRCSSPSGPTRPRPPRVERLKASPPLVFAGEARNLRENARRRAIEGRAFLLQAGDCVESFNELSTMRIREKLKIMLQMSAVLTYGATLPVVKLGRIAGQFTKPRSEPFERVGDEEIPSFRGHMVHDDAPHRRGARPRPASGWSRATTSPPRR